jgi:hypothetical protein
MTKVPKICIGRKTTSLTNDVGKTRYSTCRNLNSPYTKVNLKWIKDLDVSTNTLTLVEKNIVKTLQDIGTATTF